MPSLLVLLLSFSAYASNCEYYAYHDTIEYEGYSVNFGSYLEEKMKGKNYQRTYSNMSAPEIKVLFETENRRYFQYAVSEIRWQDMIFKKDNRCYTQSCAISDVAKVVRGTIDGFIRKLPECL